MGVFHRRADEIRLTSDRFELISSSSLALSSASMVLLSSNLAIIWVICLKLNFAIWSVSYFILAHLTICPRIPTCLATNIGVHLYITFNWLLANLITLFNLEPDHHLVQLLLLSDQLVLRHLRLLQLLLEFPAELYCRNSRCWMEFCHENNFIGLCISDIREKSISLRFLPEDPDSALLYMTTFWHPKNTPGDWRYLIVPWAVESSVCLRSISCCIDLNLSSYSA